LTIRFYYKDTNKATVEIESTSIRFRKLESEVSRLRNENANLNSEVSRLRNEIVNLNSEISRLRNENANLNSEISKLKQENEILTKFRQRAGKLILKFIYFFLELKIFFFKL
jgi:peptidoglycan hydrolase CwlO-like protein